MYYGTPNKPSPAGCVVGVFALGFGAIAVMTGRVLWIDPSAAENVGWSVTKLVAITVGCGLLSLAGFYLTWRLLRSQGPIDPDGPNVQW